MAIANQRPLFPPRPRRPSIVAQWRKPMARNNNNDNNDNNDNNIIVVVVFIVVVSLRRKTFPHTVSN